MAWNKPTSNTVGATSSSRPSGRGKMPRLSRGLIAGVIVVLGAGLAAWLLTNGEAASSPLQKKERGRIKEVEPARSPTNAVAKAKPPRKYASFWENPSTNGMSELEIRIWKHHRNPPTWTNTTASTMPRQAYEIFDSYAENEIAGLMTLEPGATLVGMPVYGERFEKEFLKSCETPIVVTDEDSEFEKQLKRDMTQMKIELRQRMADGEKLGDILKTARQDLQRMSSVKQELERNMREIIKNEAMTDEDIDTFVEAANKMLSDKGIAPIKLNPLTKRALRISAEKRRNQQ